MSAGLKKARLAWTIVFLGITLTAIVMECVAGLWHPTGWAIPWTEYIARYVPWPIQLLAYVILAVWLPFHFWRHDHMRGLAYVEGRKDGLAANVGDIGSRALVDELNARGYGVSLAGPRTLPGVNGEYGRRANVATKFLRGQSDGR